MRAQPALFMASVSPEAGSPGLHVQDEVRPVFVTCDGFGTRHCSFAAGAIRVVSQNELLRRLEGVAPNPHQGEAI